MALFLPLIAWAIWIGVYPKPYFDLLEKPVQQIVERVRPGYYQGGALARAHGWRMGGIDALPVAHLVAPTAAAYAREDAVAEARSFLSDHAYLPASELQRTLVVHRRCA